MPYAGKEKPIQIQIRKVDGAVNMIRLAQAADCSRARQKQITEKFRDRSQGNGAWAPFQEALLICEQILPRLKDALAIYDPVVRCSLDDQLVVEWEDVGPGRTEFMEVEIGTNKDVSRIRTADWHVDVAQLPEFSKMTRFQADCFLHANNGVLDLKTGNRQMWIPWQDSLEGCSHIPDFGNKIKNALLKAGCIKPSDATDSKDDGNECHRSWVGLIPSSKSYTNAIVEGILVQRFEKKCVGRG